MQEKLVENWLTNVNELSYQLPFCEVLVARGYDVIHVSSHGRGEHGKGSFRFACRAPGKAKCMRRSLSLTAKFVATLRALCGSGTSG